MRRRAREPRTRSSCANAAQAVTRFVAGRRPYRGHHDSRHRRRIHRALPLECGEHPSQRSPALDGTLALATPVHRSRLGAVHVFVTLGAPLTFFAPSGGYFPALAELVREASTRASIQSCTSLSTQATARAPIRTGLGKFPRATLSYTNDRPRPIAWSTAGRRIILRGCSAIATSNG